jgi:hypothetical protein
MKVAARSQKDQSQPRGADNGFGARGDAEFAEDGVDMELHGVLADTQSKCDGLVGQPLGDKAEDGQLARGQFLDGRLSFSITPRFWRRQPGGMGQGRGEGGVKHAQSLHQGGQGSGDLSGIGISAQDRSHAGRPDFDNATLVGQEDSDRWGAFNKLRETFNGGVRVPAHIPPSASGR